MTKIGCKRTEPKKHTLRRVSKKRAKENPKYRQVVNELREKCGDISEIPGVMEYKRNGHNTEPHHLRGRQGNNLTNVFGIVMVYANIHDYRQAHLKETREADLELVRKIRLAQGYQEEDYK